MCRVRCTARHRVPSSSKAGKPGYAGLYRPGNCRHSRIRGAGFSGPTGRTHRGRSRRVLSRGTFLHPAAHRRKRRHSRLRPDHPAGRGFSASRSISGCRCGADSRRRRWPAWLVWTISFAPIDLQNSSRNSIISRNLYVVSICSSGNGILPGKKAFWASRTIQEESFPMEYSMTGFGNSAATSRMI